MFVARCVSVCILFYHLTYFVSMFSCSFDNKPAWLDRSDTLILACCLDNDLDFFFALFLMWLIVLPSCRHIEASYGLVVVAMVSLFDEWKFNFSALVFCCFCFDICLNVPLKINMSYKTHKNESYIRN
jgi:hypothetical protein